MAKPFTPFYYGTEYAIEIARQVIRRGSGSDMRMRVRVGV